MKEMSEVANLGTPWSGQPRNSQCVTSRGSEAESACTRTGIEKLEGGVGGEKQKKSKLGRNKK